MDKTKILMTNSSFMKVESIAGAFCNTFDLHKAIIVEPIFGLFESGRFTQVLLYNEPSQAHCFKPDGRIHCYIYKKYGPYACRCFNV